MYCLVSFLLLVFASKGFAGYNIVCYYTNWSQYRIGAGKFLPENIEPDLCTHLVYAFGKLEYNYIKMVEWNDKTLYDSFNGLKNSNPDLKTLLAIGGWGAENSHFTNMVSSSVNRKLFVEQSIDFLRTYGFDGLDLDWEYPAVHDRGGKPSDKINFGLLCKELREAYELEAKSSGRKRLLVTAAVAAGKGTVDVAYDVVEMAKYLDFISLMSYDLHGDWDPVTGHNSPLFEKSTETSTQKQLNIKFAAEYWVSKGTPKSKLNIGLASYGRSFTLTDSSQYGIGAPASGPGVAGPYTGSPGFMSYYEVCDKQASGQGQTYRDSEQLVPYYVNGNQWVGFDDVESITTKVEWLISEKYAGAIVWALPLDDFNRTCSKSQRKFPLIRKITDKLLSADTDEDTTPNPSTTMSSGGPTTTEQRTKSMTTTLKSPTDKTTIPPSSTQKTVPQTTTTTRTTTTQEELPTTTSTTTHKTTQENPSTTLESTSSTSSNGFSCSGQQDGYYPNPTDCSKYILCSHGNRYNHKCGNGQLWNPTRTYCDWAINVQCNTGSQTTTVSSGFSCSRQHDGYYPDPVDCSKYIICSHGNRYTHSCGNGQLWNPTAGYCDWANRVQCNSGSQTTAPSGFSCSRQKDGYYPDPENCSKFIICSHGNRYSHSCANGQRWNYIGKYCDWANNVQCND